MLAGMSVPDRDVLDLARQLRVNGINDTAEVLEHAYDHEHPIVALTIPDREAILRALEDCPDELAELRAVLFREHVWRVSQGSLTAARTAPSGQYRSHMLDRMTITFAAPDTSQEADLLIDADDRGQLVQRLRERQLDELANLVANGHTTRIALKREWTEPLDAIAQHWLNDNPPDHLRDGLARLQAVLALVWQA
jgi:hypothetical protein